MDRRRWEEWIRRECSSGRLSICWQAGAICFSPYSPSLHLPVLNHLGQHCHETKFCHFWDYLPPKKIKKPQTNNNDTTQTKQTQPKNQQISSLVSPLASPVPAFNGDMQPPLKIPSNTLRKSFHFLFSQILYLTYKQSFSRKRPAYVCLCYSTGCKVEMYSSPK